MKNYKKITVLTALVLSLGALQPAAAEELTSTASAATELLSSEAVAEEKTEETAKEVDPEERRQEIVDFALQFVGNPYVWGGTSLTNGADCSGFVQSVFAHFGYELPRVAAAQYDAATSVSLDDVKVGDLIFYGSGISHVAIYMGDGKIVHAANSASGIITSEITYMTPVGAGSYLE